MSHGWRSIPGRGNSQWEREARRRRARGQCDLLLSPGRGEAGGCGLVRAVTQLGGEAPELD